MGGGLESRCVGRVYGADGALHGTIRIVHKCLSHGSRDHKTNAINIKTGRNIEQRRGGHKGFICIE